MSPSTTCPPVSAAEHRLALVAGVLLRGASGQPDLADGPWRTVVPSDVVAPGRLELVRQESGAALLACLVALGHRKDEVDSEIIVRPGEEPGLGLSPLPPATAPLIVGVGGGR